MEKIKSLVEARKEFATQETCEAYSARNRWPNGVTCPRCGSQDVTYMASRHQWQCVCRYQFSVTAGTVFHRTHMDLPRWFMAVSLLCHSPKGSPASRSNVSWASPTRPGGIWQNASAEQCSTT